MRIVASVEHPTHLWQHCVVLEICNVAEISVLLCVMTQCFAGASACCFATFTTPGFGTKMVQVFNIL